MRTDNVVSRLVIAIIVGVVTFLVAYLIIAIISALLPGIQIDAGFFATILGLLGGIGYFLTGRRQL